MRIVCPNCPAIYEVPASRMTQPRMVRCARCGETWMAEAEAADASQRPEEIEPPAQHQIEAEHEPLHEPPPEAMAPLTAMDRLAAPLARPPRSNALIAGWVTTGVILVVAVAATITWREQVVRAWPASSRILGSMAQVTTAQAPHALDASEAPTATKQ